MSESEPKVELPWFRIRLRNGQEIEIHAKNSIDIYERDFKSLAIQSSSLLFDRNPTEDKILEPVIEEDVDAEPSSAGNFSVMSKDLDIPETSLSQIMNLVAVNGFDTKIPVLLTRPKEEDTVLVIAYFLQVGLKLRQIDLSSFKRILTEGNGYPFPGRSLGRILQRLENSRPQLVIRFQGQKRNKALALSTEGIQKARELMKLWCDC